jgi:hypothetical protein
LGAARISANSRFREDIAPARHTAERRRVLRERRSLVRQLFRGKIPSDISLKRLNIFLQE